MYCPRCGTDIPDGSAFCQECGASVAPTTTASAAEPAATVAEQTAAPPAPPSPSSVAGQPAGPPPGAPPARIYSLPIVETAARQRVDTDDRVSFGAFLALTVFVWPAVFVVGLLLAIAADAVELLFFFILVAVITSIVPQYVFFFRLLDRRNRHFQRQHDFYRGVIQCLRERYSDDRRPGVANTLASVERLANEAALREESHSPWLWVVLLYTLMPFVGLINAWWLTRDFRDHSVRQREINDGLNNFFRLAGMRAASIVDDSVVPDRNYWVFLLLTILTGGLFSLYWIYVMMKDGNDHFARQAFVEDQVVSVLRAAA